MDILTPLAVAGQFFVKIAAELILLFIGITFLVGLLQAYIPEERIHGVSLPGGGRVRKYRRCRVRGTHPILLLLDRPHPAGAP